MKSDRGREKTDVIEEAIRPYSIAEKLRSLRQRKSMGLAQLAEHTGLSAAMLSKLENARLVPTLPTLVRIATVLNVGLRLLLYGSEEAARCSNFAKGLEDKAPCRREAEGCSLRL